MSRARADRPQAHYDRVTRAWRHLMGRNFHYGYFGPGERDLERATEALTDLMARRGRIQRRHHVLDVGCGIGEPAMRLARSVGCRVTGISTSEIGVATARESAAEQGLAGLVDFLVRDGMHSSFADESFDRVWALESTHLMPDKAAMLRDAARVLKSEGSLVLCDIMLRRDLPLREVVKRARDFDLLRLVFGRAKMQTLASYASMCREAGLRVERLDDLSAETEATFERWEVNANRYREQVAAEIGEQARSDFVRACNVLSKLWSEEVLGYGLLAAVKGR